MRPSAAVRQAFYDRMVDLGVSTGEIDPADNERVRAVLVTILIGLTDAVSGNINQHRNAIEGVKALIEGKLIRDVELG